MARRNRRDAAKFLTDSGHPVAAASLAKWAVDGSGPPYQIWNGQATYEDDDLLAWVSARLGSKERSTAAHRMARQPRWGPGRAANNGVSPAARPVAVCAPSASANAGRRDRG